MDHRHVITAIPDASDSLAAVLLDVAGDRSLLTGVASAHANRFGVFGHREELFDDLLVFVVENLTESGTIDHKQRSLFVGSRVLCNLLPDPAFVVVLCLVSSYFMCLARLLRHSGGNCDALGRLDLVPGKHPNLDSGISELLDRFQHLVLELVFDAGTGQILHALFN